MSTLIDKPGNYEVELRDCVMKQMAEKDGEAGRFEAILPGYTDDDRTVTAHVYFTKSIIGGGRNAGRKQWAVSAELLTNIGMPEPFNPAQITELNGKRARFVVELEEYEGKTLPKVAFVNPLGDSRPALTADEVTALWADMSSEGDSGGSNKSENLAADDLPF